jgi:citrate synthase
MLRGERPSDLEAQAMDAAMILMADHELNASTFAARVTASTLAGMYAAITSAIGTLHGPLHGAANQRAMEMLLEIGESDSVEPYIKAALAAKKRIMGFGHRVYKNVIDPRAVVLREMLYDLCTQTDNCHFYHLAAAVAAMVKEQKGLDPNVDFYAAPLLYTLGIPLDLFTPVFAASRIAGWTAHTMEQCENNRLLRPLSQYVGQEGKPYLPIWKRNGYASA